MHGSRKQVLRYRRRAIPCDRGHRVPSSHDAHRLRECTSGLSDARCGTIRVSSAARNTCNHRHTFSPGLHCPLVWSVFFPLVPLVALCPLGCRLSHCPECHCAHAIALQEANSRAQNGAQSVTAPLCKTWRCLPLIYLPSASLKEGMNSRTQP